MHQISHKCDKYHGFPQFPKIPLRHKTIYMKKILLAFDGRHFSRGAFEFASGLNKLQHILLTGVFLPQIDYANLWSYASAAGGPTFIPLLEDEDSESVQQNIERFKNLCKLHRIEYRLHKDFYDFALPELKRETRYADLAILSSESFYRHVGIGMPNEYLKEALHSAECPIVVVPEKYDFPKTNILAFDGSKSSVFAIKQFVYLFPELCKNETLLVYADDKETDVPESTSIEELAARHFSSLTIMKLKVDPRKYFASWISERQSAILVSGAFGRSSLSQSFKKSFVSDIIRDHRLPIFITHR